MCEFRPNSVYFQVSIWLIGDKVLRGRLSCSCCYKPIELVLVDITFIQTGT